MSLGLENKVVLVTGSGRGIGQATAIAFANSGAKVIVSDVSEGADETLGLINQAGTEALYIKADVSKAADVEAMVAKIVKIHGRLDCAVNNAGIDLGQKPLHEWSEDEWDRTIDINLKGIWLSMKYEIPQMLSQGCGVIVNTSSILGVMALPHHGVYCASKHGILGLTKTAAAECSGAGIRVNAICPGITETPLYQMAIAANPELGALASAVIPMKRTAKMEEIAKVSVWLCSDQASYVSGHAMVIDGGWTQH